MHTKYIKHIILSYFDNLQVRSLASTGIFLFWKRELDILGGYII